MKTLRQFRADRAGATAIEYSLIGAFIGIVIVSALMLLGPSLEGVFMHVDSGFAGIAP